MENTCRLCLVESKNYKILFEGCEILKKITNALTHYISLTDGLPNKICVQCIDKVNEIYAFLLKIKQNELTLQQKLNRVIKQENEQDEAVQLDNEDPFYGDETSNFSIKLDKKPESTNISKDSKTDLEVKLTNKHQRQSQSTNDDITIQIKENWNSNSLAEDLKGFKCLTCFNIFNNQLDLLKHYRTVELDKYNKENENIKEKELVEYKEVISNGTSQFECKKCFKTYKHKRFIERHIKSHIERRPYLCKICGKTYQTASIIVAHGKMHAGHLYICSYDCGYKSVHKHVVKDHEKRHRNEYKYKCETCGKGFQVRPLYEQHQNIHEGIKPFSCDICGMTFHLHRYLMTHRSNVHPQTSSRKPWICKQCSLPCDTKNSLNLHMKEVHNIIVKVTILCDICGKVLRDSRQLKDHKRSVHLNIKPYTCGICAKSFPKKFSLKVHEQIHIGKLFTCDSCNKKFSRKCTLERHIKRFHIDIKFKCQKCKKTFMSKMKTTHLCSDCFVNETES